MINEISTKNYVLVLTDKSRFFLDEKEASVVKEMIKSGAKYLEIGESLISVYSFAKLVSSSNYEEEERVREEKKLGAWDCEYGHHHKHRFEKCQHVNSLGYK